MLKWSSWQNTVPYILEHATQAIKYIHDDTVLLEQQKKNIV